MHNAKDRTKTKKEAPLRTAKLEGLMCVQIRTSGRNPGKC